MFEPQLSKNIKVYIDDMVVKSKLEFEHVNDLNNIFAILRRHKLDSMLLSVLLGSDYGSFWGTWLHTTEFKLTLTRLKQLTIYSHLGIPKKSRS